MLRRTRAADTEQNAEVCVPGQPPGECSPDECSPGGHPPGEEDQEDKAQTLFDE